MTDLAGIEVDRLPKTTAAKYITLEARGIAQIQVASELLGDSNKNNNLSNTENLNESFLNNMCDLKI